MDVNSRDAVLSLSSSPPSPVSRRNSKTDEKIVDRSSTYHDQKLFKRLEDPQQPMGRVQMSICGSELRQEQLSEEKRQRIFDDHAVDFEHFAQNPMLLLDDNNLVFRIEGRLVNYFTFVALMIARNVFSDGGPFPQSTIKEIFGFSSYSSLNLGAWDVPNASGETDVDENPFSSRSTLDVGQAESTKAKRSGWRKYLWSGTKDQNSINRAEALTSQSIALSEPAFPAGVRAIDLLQPTSPKVSRDCIKLTNFR